MKYFFCLFISTPFFLSAQMENSLPFKRHFLEISPLAVTLKKGLTYSHHLEYRFLLTRNIYINAASTFTLFQPLDYSRLNDEAGIRPLFNESSISAGYLHAFNNLTETHRRIHYAGADIGYQYIQYSTNPYSGEYTIIDSLENGYRKLGGYNVHSLKAGLNYQYVVYRNEHEKPSVKYRHFISVSYLFGLYFQLPSYVLTSPSSAVRSGNLEMDSWNSRHGGKVEYTFEHSISKRLGMLYGCSYTFSPWPQYQPNPHYFIPRGGESMPPGFLTIRAGITLQ